MPDEVQREIFEVRVEGQQAQDTLNKILEALRRIEQGMTNLGTQIDASVSKLIAPFTRLNESVTELNASISNLQANLGNTAAVQQQRQATQGLTVDYANLRAAMAKFRTRAGTFRDPIAHRAMSREQLVERYMGGRYAGMGFGPAPGGAGMGMAAPTLSMDPARALRISGQLMPQLQRPADFGLEATQETVRQEQAAVVALNSELQASIALKERASKATQQELATAQQSVEVERQKTAELGRQVAERLRAQTSAVTRARGAEVAGTLRGGRPQIIGEKEAKYTEEQVQQINILKEAIGRKIVAQELMARGSKDVAEKFERQFQVTRSKAEVLREVAKTGKLTAASEKELGLATEQTTGKTQKSNRLLMSLRNTLIRYFLIWQTMRTIKGTMSAWMAAHVEMSQALAQFEWRLGVSGDALQSYSRRLIAIATETGTAVSKLAVPLGMGADPAKLATAARAQRLFGGEMQDWLRTLDDGTGVLDQHAAAMRIAAMTTEEYSKILKASTGLAEDWNMQTGEAAGLMAGLAAETGADEQKVVALAGALSKLYDINEALIRAGSGPAIVVGAGGAQQRRPLGQIMGEISRLPVEAQRQLAREIGLTSQEQQQLFLDALAGWPQVAGAIRDTVAATGEFDRAMASSDDALKTHVDSMKQAWAGLLATIGDTSTFKNVIDGLTDIFAVFRAQISGGEDLWQEYMETLTREQRVAAGRGFMQTDYARWLRERQEAELAGPVPPGERAAARSAAEQAAAGAVPTGPAAWQQFRTTRLPEGVTIDRVIQEMERIITEDFVGVFETTSGELIEVTRASIDAERQLTLVIDEANRKPVDVYGPAWQQAVQNLQDEIKDLGRFNLERLRDITPKQFDIAMQTRLPYWEARVGEVPGFEEEAEWQNFFVGQQDVGRRQLATQTAMQYTLQDILDTEKKQLEGMWNIPAGAIMRVPLQSLDLMRWMQQGAGGAGAAGGFPGGPEVPTDLMRPVNQAGVNLGLSAAGLTTAGVNLGNAATQLSNAAGMVGGMGAGAALTQPGRRPPEGAGGVQAGVNLGRPMAGGGGAVGAVGPPGWRPTTTVRLETAVNLDGREIAKTTEEHYVRDLQNAARGRVGGLRPVLLIGFGLLPLLAQFFNNVHSLA